MKRAWRTTRCALSILLLTALLPGCALLQFPFQLLGTLGHLAGTWKDDQNRVCVIQPDGAFELRDRDGRQEFCGHCVVSGKRMIIRSNAPIMTKNIASTKAPGGALAYRFELRGNRLMLGGVRTSDDAQKRLLLLSFSSWQRQ